MESSSAGAPGGPQPCDLLIAGGIVLTLNAERLIITDGAVAITGRRITAVGKQADLAPRFAPARTIDGRGKLVMPGLVNCHSHLHVTPQSPHASANTPNPLTH